MHLWDDRPCTPYLDDDNNALTTLPVVRSSDFVISTACIIICHPSVRARSLPTADPYEPYNCPLNSLTLALAAPIHSPRTSIPVLPAYPPNPSCLTSLILGSTVSPDRDRGSTVSSAMVMLVGQSGSSNADGSGKRYLLGVIGRG